MSSDIKPLLSKGQLLGDAYEVGFLLNLSRCAQTYRVKNKAGESFVLRLFKPNESAIANYSAQATLMEASDSAFPPKLISKGKHKSNGQSFHFIIQKHISGESLDDRINRLSNVSSATAKHVTIAILKGLESLHSASPAIICNNINSSSIIIDMESTENSYHLSNYDRAHVEQANFKTEIDRHEIPYMATEAILGKGTPQSDLFSVGVILYHLLYGSPPWKIMLPEDMFLQKDIQTIVAKAREVGISAPEINSISGSNLFDVVNKSLAEDPSKRFQTANEFILALEGKATFQTKNLKASKPASTPTTWGFAAIAGMEALKETIKTDVIDALNEREKYQRYGLDIPNGMLLYGPPGCGKTFFAERMAEEVGFSLFHLKPSDIQSKWVNATQGNIKKLFDNARENAPSIVFIDELDAIVPRRDNESVNHMNTSAVNEFLAQMNNCGADGVFIVGATNKPESIDPAVLRTGRIDKKIYIPLPDHDSRKKLFEKLLGGRPLSTDVDISELASRTESYVSSDIKFICDEAARAALKKDLKITQDDLIKSINNNTPSISLSELATYSSSIN
ncbi:AAA family ATPase [Shewanella sp. 1CM18E]|uniref:AAA family ATPase n=1 Tax=Shewanella sp. 1CM18E TaxID=2929169 RepID=UPI0020C00E87|nr:AAA family ATPase [Shewanella sp. 1CM18E]MCK8043774.1 AAA family ATPase [Shewanella sp. 1CM18E]